MELINMTPHPISICNADGKTIREIPPSGWELRLEAKTQPSGNIGGIPITKTVFGEPQSVQGKSFAGQVDPWADKDGKMFIVSQMVKSAFVGKADYNRLLVPAEVLRDEKGQIIGCKSLGV